MYFEKRAQAERDPCEIQASIRVVEERSVLPCLVVNLTEGGARLQLAETARLPPLFHLALPLTDEHLDERLVELRWRAGTSAGVRFVRS